MTSAYLAYWHSALARVEEVRGSKGVGVERGPVGEGRSNYCRRRRRRGKKEAVVRDCMHGGRVVLF